MPFEFFKSHNPDIKAESEEKAQEPIPVGKNLNKDARKDGQPEDLPNRDMNLEDFTEILNSNAIAEEKMKKPSLSHTEKDEKMIKDIKAPNPDLN